MQTPQQKSNLAHNLHPDDSRDSNLTRSQFQIWLGQKLNPEAPLYNMAWTFTIQGEIEPIHFQRAFQALIDHSDIHRTVIEEIDGIPQQRTLPGFPYQMDYIDLSADPDPGGMFQTWLDQRSAILFKLGERLFDSALIKLAAGEWVWYLNQHHLITDAWSTSLAFRQVAEYYELSLYERLSQAPTLPSYSEYRAYEKAHQHSPQFKKAEAYWRSKLAKPAEPTRYYTRLPQVKSNRTQRITYTLDRERSEKLRAILAQENIHAISPHLSSFAAFATVLLTYLYRVSGNRHLSIGAPVHNRSPQVFKETMGLFMSVCPLQVEIGEQETFFSLLNKIRAEMLSALPQAFYSPGNPIGQRAWDVLLNIHTSSLPAFCGMPTEHKRIHPGYGDEGNSLSMEVYDLSEAGSFLILFDFNCDVFEKEQRPRAVQHVLNILDGFIADWKQPIHQVALLTEEEKQQVLLKWNEPQSEYSQDICLHQLFERQAERTPDRVAVVFGNERLTYQELNRQANQLAYHLQALGVRPDTLVGICIKRSLRTIVGLLGILKAGGAYVPLDPTYPRQRLAFMLADSQAPVLLAEQEYLAILPDHSIQVVCLDTDWTAIARERDENPDSGVKPHHRAYLIYTSGSTGKPKGVQIPHHAAVNFLNSTERKPGVTEQDVLLAVTTLSFDIALLELFLPLVVGGRVVIASRETAADGKRLVDTLASSGATVMQATPATWRILLDAGWQGNPGLKVLCGGEALSRELADWLLERCASLWNMYGPTETTVWSTVHQVEPGEEPVPIGHPIANTQVYVLDKQLQPVPIGVPGELHIGGDGLALGYLNHPNLTAEKFIPNPFSGEPGARLYKTGDLARYLPGGALECLGRVDSQVKIRGFRIELEEIESTLVQHSAVKEAAVIAWEKTPGDKRLVAYVAIEGRGEPSTISHRSPLASELRRFLQENLPDYMVPATFVFIEALPLTPNRKVDRTALPAPNLAGIDPDRTLAEPRDEFEHKLIQIWEEVLGQNGIGIQDNFFDLGGHSLLAARLFAQIEQVFGVNLPLASLIQGPTVEKLAQNLRQEVVPTGALAGDHLPPDSKQKLFHYLQQGFRLITNKFDQSTG